jgi:hypothetical protein
VFERLVETEAVFIERMRNRVLARLRCSHVALIGDKQVRETR